jgi:hypothetical protein
LIDREPKPDTPVLSLLKGLRRRVDEVVVEDVNFVVDDDSTTNKKHDE